MRIVVTKNGTKILEDLSSNNSIINYNSESEIALTDINRFKQRMRRLTKNRSVNQHGNLKKNRYFSQSLSHFNILEKKIDVNDMLNNIKLNKNNSNNTTNKNTINLKIIKLKNKKKIKLPKLLENRYILYDLINDKEIKKDYIPNIILSINNTMNNAKNNKKNMIRNKTTSVLNTINNLENSENKKLNININNKVENFPKIRESFPIKYIIDKNSYNRLNREMKILKNNINMKNKIFPKNYFIHI